MGDLLDSIVRRNGERERNELFGGRQSKRRGSRGSRGRLDDASGAAGGGVALASLRSIVIVTCPGSPVESVVMSSSSKAPIRRIIALATVVVTLGQAGVAVVLDPAVLAEALIGA